MQNLLLKFRFGGMQNLSLENWFKSSELQNSTEYLHTRQTEIADQGKSKASILAQNWR